jgi:hypothetical protein
VHLDATPPSVSDRRLEGCRPGLGKRVRVSGDPTALDRIAAQRRGAQLDLDSA